LHNAASPGTAEVFPNDNYNIEESKEASQTVHSPPVQRKMVNFEVENLEEPKKTETVSENQN
jgi:hypothetical protein